MVRTVSCYDINFKQNVIVIYNICLTEINNGFLKNIIIL